jgi:hypothetical protein
LIHTGDPRGEPIQAFVLHWEAWPKHAGNGSISWFEEGDDSEPVEIVRWIVEKHEDKVTIGRLDVRRDRLLSFLSTFGFDLAIYHDARTDCSLQDGWRDEDRAILTTGVSARAQEPKPTAAGGASAEQVIRLTPAELRWTAGPPMLPPGASMAVIEGSFSKSGPFTVRLKFPANYRIPAHWHPVKVTVTVISGSFNMGFGDELDLGKGKMLPAGSIFEMPAKIHHFGWTTEETIIQEHGIGPLSVNYLKQAHDAPHR